MIYFLIDPWRGQGMGSWKVCQPSLWSIILIRWRLADSKTGHSAPGSSSSSAEWMGGRPQHTEPSCWLAVLLIDDDSEYHSSEPSSTWRALWIMSQLFTPPCHSCRSGHCFFNKQSGNIQEAHEDFNYLSAGLILLMPEGKCLLLHGIKMVQPSPLFIWLPILSH